MSKASTIILLSMVPDHRGDEWKLLLRNCPGFIGLYRRESELKEYMSLKACEMWSGRSLWIGTIC